MIMQFALMCVMFNVVSFADCKSVEDEDKRSFDDLRPILMDVDNDGKPDTILPHVFSLKANRTQPPGKRRRAKEINWIVFDLKTSKGRVLTSFFRYEYGGEPAAYWVYALEPCDTNKDGRVDLIFYSGDDTSDETIVLLNRNGRFVVHSREKSRSKI